MQNNYYWQHPNMFGPTVPNQYMDMNNMQGQMNMNPNMMNYQQQFNNMQMYQDQQNHELQQQMNQEHQI